MFHRILVATDDTVPAQHAVREAIALATQQGAELTVLHVVNFYDAVAAMQMAGEDLFEQHLASMCRRGREILDRAVSEAHAAGLEARTKLQVAKVDGPAQAICAEACEGYDLLVLGTHGRHGWQRLTLGSDAEQAMRHAPIPVLLVHGDDAAEPA